MLVFFLSLFKYIHMEKETIVERDLLDKITNHKDIYIIFFDYSCPYSRNALEFLKNKKFLYKGYEISKINGGMPLLLEIFRKNKETIGFDSNHRTKPIIFFNKKFIGGFTELSRGNFAQ